jgi:histidyl-tRNA synthetase
MKIPPVKGTRDFYPPVMAIRNFIVDGWKAAAVRNGFVEYDGPIFEYLKMFQVKSGDEIVEQLFSFRDRGDRELAIRPEITPTLARMVNQQINALPRPIKWFSVPRLCRAERPQKGRLREFFQWNIDIIGVDDILADAEVVFCAVDYLRSVGLGAKDIVVKISSRSMLAEFLKVIGIAEEQLDEIYALLDKKAKLSEEAFAAMMKERIADADIRTKVTELMAAETIDQLSNLAAAGDGTRLDGSIQSLKKLFGYLEAMGIADYCEFDIGIVRGLAYYTGSVFEIYDRDSQLRAIGGGGRYDNLLKDFGGPAVSGTGMGMGDCVLEILLREKGLLNADSAAGGLDYFIACLDAELLGDAVAIAANLRGKGLKVDFSYKSVALGKQLKQASARGAKKCIIVGAEYADEKALAIKDMTTGEQQTVNAESFLTESTF